MRDKVLLINEKTLKENSLIDSNIDGKYILPSIELAQNIDLQNVIGKALYDKLIKLVKTNEISLPENADYKYLLDNYITDYLIWQTMSTIQISVNYKFKQSGMIQNQDDRKAAIDYSEGKALASQYEKYANAYCEHLKNYLLKNTNIYPEYMKCDTYQYAMDAPLCSIFLNDIDTLPDYKYK